MAANQYIGPPGGDWFDPTNWSFGTVPGPGDIADLFGSSPNETPTGVYATSGTLSGLTIDLSGVAGPGQYNDGYAYYDRSPMLTAGTVGTDAAPVTLDVTADSGTASDAAVILESFDGSIDVAAGQRLEIMAGFGPTLTGQVTVHAGATLDVTGRSASGYYDPPHLELDADVVVDAGVFVTDASGVTGTGQFRLIDGGTLDLAEYYVSTDYVGVAFGDGGGTLIADGLGNAVSGTISGFAAGDSIRAYNKGQNGYPFEASYTAGTLTVSEMYGSVDSFVFAGDYTIDNFNIVENGYDFIITYQPCFVTGTPIATPFGDIAVEDLQPGDRVTLHDASEASVIWVGHRRAHDCDVIHVRAGTLGARRDLVLSDDHALFVDGVLVPAGLLVDGERICAERRDSVTLHHVELDRHAILLAAGVAAESYLDTGNRSQFGNCPFAYDPVQAAANEPCAELVVAGSRLDEVRERLARSIPVG